MKTIIASLLLILLIPATGQANRPANGENLLISKTWQVTRVKSRRPYVEIGEKFNFRVDRSFYYDQNNYAKRGGDWILDKKDLVLVYDSFTEERRKIPVEYKVKKLRNGELVLKYRNRNNRKEVIYLQ